MCKWNLFRLNFRVDFWIMWVVGLMWCVIFVVMLFVLVSIVWMFMLMGVGLDDLNCCLNWYLVCLMCSCVLIGFRLSWLVLIWSNCCRKFWWCLVKLVFVCVLVKLFWMYLLNLILRFSVLIWVFCRWCCDGMYVIWYGWISGVWVFWLWCLVIMLMFIICVLVVL